MKIALNKILYLLVILLLSSFLVACDGDLQEDFNFADRADISNTSSSSDDGDDDGTTSSSSSSDEDSSSSDEDSSSSDEDSSSSDEDSSSSDEDSSSSDEDSSSSDEDSSSSVSTSGLFAPFFSKNDVLVSLREVEKTSTKNSNSKENVINLNSPKIDSGNWLGDQFEKEKSASLNLDTDGDGYTDSIEDKLETDKDDASSTPPLPVTKIVERLKREGDLDVDGLAEDNDPNTTKHDTDGDGFLDGIEVISGFDPSDENSYPTSDEDQDGVGRALEEKLQIDPKNADSDYDGLTDGDEIALGTNPNSADSDNDGILDGVEVKTYRSDPLTSEPNL